MRDFWFALILVVFALPAWSHEETDARNRVSLQVEAHREIPNDWATARLTVVAEGKAPSAVAEVVNGRMKKALSTARRAQGVEVESGAYLSQPVYADGRIVRWRARQELRLESGDVGALSALIGSLQTDSVLLSGIDFSIRAETRSALEDELIAEALAAFRARATRIAKGMGANDWSLIALSVGDADVPPRRVHMRAEAETMSLAKATPPVFEAGTSEIRMRADGTVELE